MNNDLHELIHLSRHLGADTQLTQGGGGNTSVKTDDGQAMYIKASGSALAKMSSRRGWRELNLASVLGILGDTSLRSMDMVARERCIAQRLRQYCQDTLDSDAGPSIEAHFHALLGKVTAHLHPFAAGPYLCSKQGSAAVAELFPRDVLWLNYADLGYSSARRMQRGVKRYQREFGKMPQVVFLQKHGVVITGDSADEVIKTTGRIMKRCWSGLGRWKTRMMPQASDQAKAHARKIVKQVGDVIDGVKQNVAVYDDEIIRRFLGRDDAETLAGINPLVPHEISYAHGHPIFVKELSVDAVAAQLQQRQLNTATGYPAMLIPKVGMAVMAARGHAEIIRDVMQASLLTRMCVEQFGGACPLTKRETDFIYQVYIHKYTQWV